MILHDPVLDMAFRDYGIMLPIAPDRAGRVVEFLGGGTGRALPFPGPILDIRGALDILGEAPGKPLINRAPGGPAVLDRRDLERVHQRDFIAALYGEKPGAPQSPLLRGPDAGNGLEAALLNTYELIDSQGRPHRYEPERAVQPLSALFDTILAQAGGTYLACRLALATIRDGEPAGASAPGFCYYLGGGMHHARYDSGSGFCLVNDVVIAARKIQAEDRARRIWVVDVDAHKGDGTAELVSFARARGELDGAGGNTGGCPVILTLSVHMASGWPLDAENLNAVKNTPAGGGGRAPLLPSDLDTGIEAGEEDTYIPRLDAGLRKLEELSGRPDLVIVVDGADPYEHDGLPSSGLLRLSLDQCLERDRLIYAFLRDRNLPSAWIMAGGYGDRAWEPPAWFLRELMTHGRRTA
jgi:acetoin utilization deacetylase AcuC-like enzyme